MLFMENTMEKQVPKLAESDIQAAVDAWKLYTLASSKLTDRMDYIIRRCIEIAGGKLGWWDWLGDGDYEDRASGDFMQSYDKDQLSIRAEWDIKREIIFLDKNGGEWGLCDGIPTRWLYEDFEEEFSNGLKAYKEKEKQQKEKAKENKQKREQEKKALITTATAKLSKEERKLLGIK
jgi:hypothetical protein